MELGTVLDAACGGTVGRCPRQPALPYGTRFPPASMDGTTGSPLPDKFLRPPAGYADIQSREPAGTSNYHSTATQRNKRFSKGLQFGVAWMWSKAMTIVHGNGNAVNP